MASRAAPFIAVRVTSSIATALSIAPAIALASSLETPAEPVVEVGHPLRVAADVGYDDRKAGRHRLE